MQTGTGQPQTSLVTTEALVEIGRAAGLAAVGVTSADVLEPARTTLRLRKARGLAGDMQFTYRNPERSTEPGRALRNARSLIAGAWAYGPMRAPGTVGPAPTGAVARYAWHDHYADLERALQPMADRLVDAGHRARIVADTNVLVDRNVAWRAGLGWYGKNANLLLPDAGSWFVLGAIVTDLELAPTGPPLADGCGSCNQCIDDCPTGAIVAPGMVDATRCLAWIVQAGGPIPHRWREAVGDRIYGCDDCQDVCPPNRRVDRLQIGVGPVAAAERVRVDLLWLLTAADEDILARHGRWYIAGRDVDVIRRTALVVLGNTAEPTQPGVVDLLRRYLAHDRPLLRAHAVWAARRLGRGDLLPADPDPDPSVAAESDLPVTARFAPADWPSGRGDA
ncbi:MAG: tRNA epoxyqueuosine(34) reductase QueG [Actinomycetota bacterium]